jgi:hypothetical protein
MTEGWLSQIYTNPEQGIPAWHVDRIAEFFQVEPNVLLMTDQDFEKVVLSFPSTSDRRLKRDRRVVLNPPSRTRDRRSGGDRRMMEPHQPQPEGSDSRISSGPESQTELALNGIIDDGVGMSLRDYFAAQALTGLITLYGPNGAGTHEEEIGRQAYRCADALLRARQVLTDS